MLELFGVLTAAALSCSSVQAGCVSVEKPQALAIAQDGAVAVAPKPTARPTKDTVEVAKPRNTARVNLENGNDGENRRVKRKVQLVSTDGPAVRQAVKPRKILLIGNFF